MTAQEIKDYLKNAYAYRTSSIFIPEYTWKGLRIEDQDVRDIYRDVGTVIRPDWPLTGKNKP